MDLLALFTSRVFGENLYVTESHSATGFHFTPSLKADFKQQQSSWRRTHCLLYLQGSLLPLCIYTNSNGWGKKKSQQINSLIWHAVSMPLSINRVEVEICWPLSSATAWLGNPTRCRDCFGRRVQVYEAVSTPDATGRAPAEGGWIKQNSLAKQCGSILNSTWHRFWRPVVLQT